MKNGLRDKFVLATLTNIFLLVTLAQEKPGVSAHDLAMKLSNPVASLISVPFQSNVDYGIGDSKGSKYTLNIQPVIPFKLSPKLNLITRYIIPVINQYDVTGDGKGEFGLSDATISAFFSPVTAGNGLFWGAGPAFLVPISTNNWLGPGKWALGPTALLLHQAKGFTYGVLANQIWSFAGDKSSPGVNQLFLQPFFAYNWKSGAGLSINSEMTKDWQNNTTTAFLNPLITGVSKLGRQAISLGIGPRIPLAAPSQSKPDFGLRADIKLVFPQ